MEKKNLMLDMKKLTDACHPDASGTKCLIAEMGGETLYYVAEWHEAGDAVPLELTRESSEEKMQDNPGPSDRLLHAIFGTLTENVVIKKSGFYVRSQESFSDVPDDCSRFSEALSCIDGTYGDVFWAELPEDL